MSKINLIKTEFFGEYVGSFINGEYDKDLITKMKLTSPLREGYMYIGYYNNMDIYAPHFSLIPTLDKDVPHEHANMFSKRAAFLYKKCLQYDAFNLTQSGVEYNIHKRISGGYNFKYSSPVKFPGVVYRWDFEKGVWEDQFDAEKLAEWNKAKEERMALYSRVKKEFIARGFDYDNHKTSQMSNMILLLDAFENDQLSTFTAKECLKYKAWSHLTNCGLNYQFNIYLDDVRTVLNLYIKKHPVSSSAVSVNAKSSFADCLNGNDFDKLQTIKANL